MAKLISEVPDPGVFFKSLLEYDIANLVTILGFDSACIKTLLCSSRIEKIDHSYPIFHKICNWRPG